MSAVKTRRDRYAEMTRQALLDAGHLLFARDGFHAVTAQDVAAAAGLTRGALYHHFDGKLGLFEAVVEDLEARAAARIESAVAAVAAGSATDRALTGLAAFLDECTDEAYRRVVLHDGPVALGRERWQALDARHLSGVLRDAVQALLDEGAVAEQPVELLSATLFAMLTELGTWIAEAPDRSVAREQAMSLARAILRGLAA